MRNTAAEVRVSLYPVGLLNYSQGNQVRWLDFAPTAESSRGRIKKMDVQIKTNDDRTRRPLRLKTRRGHKARDFTERPLQGRLRTVPASVPDAQDYGRLIGPARAVGIKQSRRRIATSRSAQGARPELPVCTERMNTHLFFLFFLQQLLKEPCCSASTVS